MSNKKCSHLCCPNFKIMIAVIKVGQQYKVEKIKLYLYHIEGNAGDSIDLEVLFAQDGKLSVGSNLAAKSNAEIVDQIKGDKVIALKKRKKGFQKKKGHKTAYIQNYCFRNR